MSTFYDHVRMSLVAVSARNIWIGFSVGIILIIISRLLSSTGVWLSRNMVVGGRGVWLSRVDGGSWSISLEFDTCCRCIGVMNRSTNALRLIGNWRELPRRNRRVRCRRYGWLLRLLFSLFGLTRSLRILLCLSLGLLLLLPSFPFLSYLLELCSRDIVLALARITTPYYNA